MNIKTTAEVCTVRTTLGLSCRRCEFNGDVCDYYKNKYHIQRPAEYMKPQNTTGGKENVK